MFPEPAFPGLRVFGDTQLCHTWQLEHFVADVRAQPVPSGASIHVLEYEVISAAHASRSTWHHWFDDGHALAADVNLYDTSEQTEFQWLLEHAYPLARRWRLAVTFPAVNGHGVPGHSLGDGLHLHADVGAWSNTGSGAFHAAWTSAMADAGAARAGVAGPATDGDVLAQGRRGPLVKRLQHRAGVTDCDGVFGEVTARAVRALQRRLAVTADARWGPASETAYRRFCDGRLGERTIRLWQSNAGTPVDGRLFVPSPLVERVQRRHGARPDGVLGADTWTCLQRWLRVRSDGVEGPETVRALQQALLRGEW